MTRPGPLSGRAADEPEGDEQTGAQRRERSIEEIARRLEAMQRELEGRAPVHPASDEKGGGPPA